MTSIDALLEPYLYLHQNKGKEIRSQLIEAFSVWLKVPAPTVAAVTEIISTLHTASLLIDDIQDNSELRRGKPVAHHVFGTPATIGT